MRSDRQLVVLLALSIGWVGLAVVLSVRLEPAVLEALAWLRVLPPHTVRHLSISALVLLGLPLLWRRS